MDIDKMANVIVSGCGGFSFGHWNLSKGIREREAERVKSILKRQCCKNRGSKGCRICHNDKTKGGSAE